MTYVPGFTNDVFVSYATIDNEVIVYDGEHHKGWIDTLIEKLRRELCSRLGERQIRFFIDHESMRANRPITPQLIEAARSSATLLVIMSPAYLASNWCKVERNAFLCVVSDRIATGSMLLVRARPVSRSEQSEEFRDLRGIELFVPEPDLKHRMLGSPDANELMFIQRICTVTEELADQLRRLRTEHDVGKPVVSGGELPARTTTNYLEDREKVFIAAATDDLEDREKELHRYLSQTGLNVLPSPQSRYPTTDLASYEDAVLRELRGCRAFAQLISTSRGRELEFAPGRRLPSLQAELARRAELPILQWRSPQIDLDGVGDPEHRVVLEGAQACGFEQFKRAVLDEVRKKPSPVRPPPSQLVVFVNANAPDRGLARELGNALSAMGVDCYWPIDGGPPESIRADLEEGLNSCDGLVLVYGETRLDWIHQQLRQARKTLAVRERPIKTLAVYEGPPPEKPNLAAAIPQLVMLDCRQGVNPHELRKFVDRLQESPS